MFKRRPRFLALLVCSLLTCAFTTTTADACTLTLTIAGDYVRLTPADDHSDVVEMNITRHDSTEGTINVTQAGSGAVVFWEWDECPQPDGTWTKLDGSFSLDAETDFDGNGHTIADYFIQGTTVSATTPGVTVTGIWTESGTTPNPEDSDTIAVVEVDLDIHHGQGGSQVSEETEESIGATTVANLNDTDGDGRADNNDTVVMDADTPLTAAAAEEATTIAVVSVVGYAGGDRIGIAKSDFSSGEPRTVQSIDEQANTITLTEGLGQAYAVDDWVYHPGRDEEDLMKLVLRKPAPDLGGNVVLKVASGSVNIWQTSMKQTEVTLTAGQKSYAMANFPATKTVYVEATTASANLRDIVLEWEYVGLKDTVKATAAWVEKTTHRAAPQTNTPWCTRDDGDGWPDNPKVGSGGQLPDLNLAGIVTSINTTFKANDGSRYGHGRIGAVGGSDTMFGGRILYEFQVVPAGVEDLGVQLDVTQQVWSCSYYILIGSKQITPYQGGANDFPWLGSPPRDNELPNDDHVGCHDSTPENGHVYAWDAPEMSDSSAANDGFSILRASFKTWVRIRLQGAGFGPLHNDTMGSRASPKYDWHFLGYAKRNPLGEWVKDDTSPSACASRLTTGTPTDKGTLDVTVDTENAETEGWTVTYDRFVNAWTVVGDDGSTGALVWKEVPEVWFGCGEKGGDERVSLEIAHTPGKGLFVTTDEFKFSTFKSTAGKQNVIAEGTCTPTGDP